MKHQTHEEIRIEFINNCIINPINKASSLGLEFNLSDEIVGRSVFEILVDKGIVTTDISFMQKYFDLAEKKIGKPKEELNSLEPSKVLSLKEIMNGRSKITNNKTEIHEEVISLARYMVSNEWCRNSRVNGVNFQDTLNYY
jgi:hypothetical protein